MEKNISTHTKGISQADMEKWIEAVVQGTVDGKQVDDKTAKQLDRIGSRSVSLEEATRIANAFNAIDLMMIIMEDELGVTQEQVGKAKDKLNEKREAYLKEKQEELRQKQQEEVQKETESDSNEKVIQLKKNDEQ